MLVVVVIALICGAFTLSKQPPKEAVVAERIDGQVGVH